MKKSQHFSKITESRVSAMNLQYAEYILKMTRYIKINKSDSQLRKRQSIEVEPKMTQKLELANKDYQQAIATINLFKDLKGNTVTMSKQMKISQQKNDKGNSEMERYNYLK